MKRILVIFAGGTIASGFQGNTKFAAPDANNFKSIHKTVKKFFKDKSIDEVICREPLGIPGKDSSNIHPGYWLKITALISSELKKGLDGVLILYGTDTMAYLSAWLKVCFPKIPIPIIVTGSQLTLDYLPGDVLVNLRGAAQVVCSDFSGVWIYCNWKLIPGDRAHKAHALHPDIFTALNSMPVYFNYMEYMKSLNNLIKINPKPNFAGFGHFGVIKGSESIHQILLEHKEFMELFRKEVINAYNENPQTKHVVEKLTPILTPRTDLIKGGHPILSNIILGIVYGMMIDLGYRKD